MSLHRPKWHEYPAHNSSFSHHQQSVQHHPTPCEHYHRKKVSFTQKSNKTSAFNRLKTEDRDASLRQEALMAASKLTPSKQRSQPARHKKVKHSASVIHLSREAQGSKNKGSSTVTKRKQSAAEFGDRIRQKTEDFRILSHCLEVYVREQRINSEDVNIGELIKLIGAFNRSQIRKFSRPLQQLIGEIIKTIQVALPVPSHAKQPHSPVKMHPQISTTEDVIGTVKKGMSSRQTAQNKSQMAGDVQKLEDNLGRLKYQSNRLRYFLDEIAAKNTTGEHNNKSRIRKEAEKEEQEKLAELQHLREIAVQQEQIIHQLQADSDSNDTFRQEAPL